MGKILHAHKKLEKECILTAFSLNPTYECFQLVCTLAECGAESDEKTDENGVSQSGSIDALPTIISADTLLNSEEYDALRAPNRLLDSLTSISEGVRADLVCLLTVPRIKSLNWLKPWPELKKACEELLSAERKRQLVEKTTANANDNLKYINENLNYDDFKDFTPHEYPGIEKGYEIYVADSDSDESHVIATGDIDSEGTDTAPESKEFILKEEKRLRDRKRRLIKRSQKMLEESEIDNQIKKEPDESEQKRKKPRRLNQSDCLKPRKPNRKTQPKQQKSIETEDNSMQSDTSTFVGEQSTSFGTIDTELPSNFVIKTEPTDDMDQQTDEDASKTFADLSNTQQFKTENFPMNDNFFAITSNQYEPIETSKENGIVVKNEINQEPLSNFSELTYLPHQFEQSDNESTTICYNAELVNSIICDETKNESLEQTFPKICDEDFDEDDKANIHFQQIVMNKMLGLNENHISYFTNDETINNIESMLETKSQSPVINELCPLKHADEIENIELLSSSCKSSCDVPSNTISDLNVQSQKTKKNPLLAFRKPKKNSIKPDAMVSKDLNGHAVNSIDSELPTSEGLPKSSSPDVNSENRIPENVSQNQQNNVFSWMTDQEVEFKGQVCKCLSRMSLLINNINSMSVCRLTKILKKIFKQQRWMHPLTLSY